MHFPPTLRTFLSMNRSVRLTLYVILFFAILPQAWGQIPLRGVSERGLRDDLAGIASNKNSLPSLQVLNFPASDSGLSRVDVLFRLSPQNFVFVRNDVLDSSGTANVPSPFFARAEISVEFIDSTGTSTARDIVQKKFDRSKPTGPGDERESFQGAFSFTIRPGKYKVLFQAIDLESDRKFVDKSKVVTARNFSIPSLETSDIIFLESSPTPINQRTRIVALNYGGDALFGVSFDATIEGTSRSSSVDSLSMTYSLYRMEDLDTTFVVRDSLLKEAILPSRHLGLLNEETGPAYKLQEAPPEYFVGKLHIDGNHLPMGQYELLVVFLNGKTSVRRLHPFQLRWLGMPASLFNLDFAIEALEYIASKDEMRELRSGSEKKRRQKFEEFWNHRDPTPETALNEALAEYYRRVDASRLQFATLKNPNGFKSDRGKIYVLYGEPTRKERKLSPGGPPTEVWEYENLKKKFVFTDTAKNGTYILTATETL